MKTDREIGERRNGKLDRIAVRHRPCGNDGTVATAEAQLADAVRDDRRSLVAQRDRRGANDQRAIAIGIRDPHPQPLAADADARVQPDRLIGETRDTFGRRRSSRPRSDPTFVAWHDHPRFLGKQV